MSERNKISAVIFDMDGVMLDTERIHNNELVNSANFYGFELAQESLPAFHGLSRRAFIEQSKILYGPNFPAEAILNRRANAVARVFEEQGIACKPYLMDLVNFLKQSDLPFAVATSTGAQMACYKLKKAGIAQDFKILIAGDQVTNSKPAPDIFIEASRRLAVATDRCLVIEDSEVGIIAASVAGMRAIHIQDLYSPSQTISKLALKMFRSLEQVIELFKNRH